MNAVAHPQKTLKYLVIFCLFLLAGNLLSIVLKLHFVWNSAFMLVPVFNFNNEANLPTYFNALELLAAGLLLVIITAFKRQRGEAFKSWLILALVFLFLSVDEISSIHELLMRPVRHLIKVTGFFSYAWVIPYGIGAMIFAITYLRFLFKLPRRTGILFVLSGLVYVGGAIGLEMVGAWYDTHHGQENYGYSLLYTFEEFLEMLGAAFFIYSLLDYITTHLGILSLSLKSPTPVRS